jgi:hypothetical protein
MRVLVHDEKAAARAAEQFARILLVGRDLPKAYAMMSPEAHQTVPASTLSDSIVNMHPRSYPSQVSAKEFEPVPGQRAMNIYLHGHCQGEEFDYCFLMVGDKESGYQVSSIGRRDGPYPPSNRRPL